LPIPVYDLAIIGGGINGCGIARDAVGRGLTVHLCEQGDLAGATSSASTKLIHGGLRYLEHFAFRLVREALAEREVLLAMAPHIVRPLRLVLPHGPGSRPRFMLGAGLFLYDRLGGRKLLPPTSRIELKDASVGRPLKREFQFAFEYSDCWVEDARLVVLNAVDARARGAHIHTRTRCIAAKRVDSYWRLLLEATESGERRQIAARVIVNAAGPWVASVLDEVIKGNARAPVRLVKGTHIVTRRLYDHDRAYVLQNTDRRIVFAIPFEHDFTLIGTTDSDYRGDPAAAKPDEAEIEYLCKAASRYFRKPVTREDIRFAYSGVRPLYNDGASRAQEATRDYVLDLDGTDGSTPLLSVIGGKITTYRRLAEHALARLAPYLRMGEPWTARAPLPGGAFAIGRGGDLVRALRAAYPFLSELHAERLVNSYGTRAAMIVTGARRAEDLGRNFGYDLTEAEVAYLMAEEWAVTAGDVLWRRSRLGLRFSAAQAAALGEWMAEAHRRATVPAA
jgi:glycerol-3-phosphate dehydrogenase